LGVGKSFSQRFQQASQATLPYQQEDYTPDELLLILCHAPSNPIALKGFEGRLPCPCTSFRIYCLSVIGTYSRSSRPM
jgi:hypothetical protein